MGAGASHRLLQSLIAFIWDLPGRARVQLLPEANSPWGFERGAEALAPHGDEHVGRDFTAVLHQLYLISLHDPPRDGILARPQAAVQDVVAAVHVQDTSQHQETEAEKMQLLHCVAESGRGWAGGS